MAYVETAWAVGSTRKEADLYYVDLESWGGNGRQRITLFFKEQPPPWLWALGQEVVGVFASPSDMRVCARCGMPYPAPRHFTKYCSRACGASATSARQKTKKREASNG